MPLCVKASLRRFYLLSLYPKSSHREGRLAPGRAPDSHSTSSNAYSACTNERIHASCAKWLTSGPVSPSSISIKNDPNDGRPRLYRLIAESADARLFQPCIHG